VTKFDFFTTKREIFAKRVPHPVIRHQDAAQVWMPSELNTEEVKDFSLWPNRCWINLSRRWAMFIQL
jgi:hypothetical protein